MRPDEHGKFPCLVTHEDFWEGDVALGNGTQWRFCVLDFEGAMVIAIRGKSLRKWTDGATPQQVEKGYGIMKGDAGNVADFINCQFRRPSDPFGFYLKPFCDNPDPP